MVLRRSEDVTLVVLPLRLIEDPSISRRSVEWIAVSTYWKNNLSALLRFVLKFLSWWCVRCWDAAGNINLWFFPTDPWSQEPFFFSFCPLDFDLSCFSLQFVTCLPYHQRWHIQASFLVFQATLWHQIIWFVVTECVVVLDTAVRSNPLCGNAEGGKGLKKYLYVFR